MTILEIDDCSPGCSIQDRGRLGWRRSGLPRSGALDLLAHAAANTLVGNAIWTAAIELFAGGMSLRAVGGAVRLALAGAEFQLQSDDARIPANTSFVLHPNQRLRITGPRHGMCATLAVEGGIDVDEVLGSRSLHAKSRLGGLQGRAVSAGDRISIGRVASTREDVSLPPVDLCADKPVRVVLGPQLEYFDDTSLDTFLSEAFVVAQGDRMGFRLTGPQLAYDEAISLISEGIVEGAVQVTSAGEPLVMLADQQTIGGYPKIACVVSADLRIVAQRQPGASVRFEAISLDAARSALKRELESFCALPSLLRPSQTQLKIEAVADSAVNAFDTGTWAW